MVAPPGYGKTTVLAQWAERKGPTVAWVSVDGYDNDPAVLLAYIARGARPHRAHLSDGVPCHRIVGGGDGGARRLASAMAAMDRPVTLVVDHLEALTNRECLDTIALLAVSLPARSQLAIGSRDVLPAGGTPACTGRIVEVGVDDLAMTSDESSMMLREAEVELADDDLRGSPSEPRVGPRSVPGVLASRAGGTPTGIGGFFTGDDRYMGDYLRSEFLDRVSQADVSFLTHTSILERMCGPLCARRSASRDRVRSSSSWSGATS